MSRAFDVIVVGASQAGLAMGWHLARAGVRFTMHDASARVGDAWRARWDSLTLFTPAEYSGLPGTPFPAPRGHHPTRDEVADYLESYAAEHALPVRLGERVTRLAPANDGGFELETAGGAYRARQVVVATGPFQRPVRPAFGAGLAPAVRQLHAAEYRGPSELPSGRVVVVGGGNTGLQLAAELALTHPVTLCLGTPGTVLPARLLGRSIFAWLEATGMMRVPVTTALGRRASRRQVIIGPGPRAVARRQGVRLAGRAIGADGPAVLTADGERIQASTVVWATGYRPDFSWIDAPVFDPAGVPQQRRGVTMVQGLYFLGLSWLHTRGSGLVGWVGRDAAFLAAHMTQQTEA